MLTSETLQALPQTPEEWIRPAIVLLDVGMATHLTDAERRQMVDLFRAFCRLDGAAMAHSALAFSGDQQGCPDPEVCELLQTLSCQCHQQV